MVVTDRDPLWCSKWLLVSQYQSACPELRREPSIIYRPGADLLRCRNGDVLILAQLLVHRVMVLACSIGKSRGHHTGLGGLEIARAL